MNNYQSYLKSEHWSLLRGAKLQVHPHCQRCGEKSEIEVHHKIYRKKWADAKITDLETLCHNCHTLHHAADFAKDTLPLRKIKRIVAIKRPAPIQEHRAYMRKPEKLPQIQVVTWLNRTKFKITKESYAWLKEKGLSPEKAGWRDRLSGNVCPARFMV